ncbi:nitrous oxide reductase family maturation protein NosD [Prevotella histicola]|uniref:nitrous oxide reductase family maturation protein NosD n=1 Tax=Prevotella histicola TaxID=470565 RepID=UPI001CAECD2B|nr:nitrous oxide reductase family maturation protein NosD [Prevotella histicola]MBF1402880.1 nitrous oxide reductase family maturation protein NosD [Prevotella histicola]
MGKIKSTTRRALTTLICLSFSIITLSARTIEVGEGKAFSSISAALHKAKAKDEILIYGKKIYKERLVIQKPITLKGVGTPIIDGGQRGDVIKVNADNVTIEGLQIQNSARSSQVDYCGVHVKDAQFVTVRNCVFRKNQFSVMFQNCKNGLIANNNISSNITYNPIMGNAVHCWKSDNMHITGNNIGHNRDGIYLEFVNNSHIDHNTVSGCARYGLHFMFSHFNVYSSNRFNHNQAGVAVMFAHNVEMINNTFEFNRGTSSYGLLIKELQYSTIKWNRFLDNTVGLLIDGGSDLNVHHNVIKNNGWGMRLISASTNDTIRHNNFLGNTFDMTTNVSYNRNNVNGNYWDKYEGYDLNKDGYGDVPFHPLSLFSMLAEQNENVLFFFHSFLMNLLDATEKVLPSITPDNYVDNYPHMNPYKL